MSLFGCITPVVFMFLSTQVLICSRTAFLDTVWSSWSSFCELINLFHFLRVQTVLPYPGSASIGHLVITLVLMLGRSYIKGNEIAYQVAEEGAGNHFYGLEPTLGVSKAQVKEELQLQNWECRNRYLSEKYFHPTGSKKNGWILYWISIKTYLDFLNRNYGYSVAYLVWDPDCGT